MLLDSVPPEEIVKASIIILYLLLDLIVGKNTKYRSVAVTITIFSIFFAISVALMLVLKIKEKLCQKK